ncbi:hypothetical protein [Paenibacillus sp. 1P07SE]|uniref:hypothetical protein n=1 Tax=Paenibacillus sp. 1P07SE TaxID=3132209 RepID=UPI0039A71FF5
MKERWFVGAAAVLLLAGCAHSSGTDQAPVDGMAAEEGCFVKKEPSGEKVCYGMKRSEVELVAGTGEPLEDLLLSYKYAGGIRVSYRGDKAVFLNLQAGGDYATIRGTTVGTSKNEMKTQYGEAYALDEAEPNLDYFFDLDKETPLDQDILKGQRTPEEMERTLVVSAMFDSNGSADRLMILDRRMAVYFN